MDKTPRETAEAGPIYRVDKFAVPDDAREEFLARVHSTHELLRTLPGFVRDLVLEQSSGPGEFNFVTVVEWEGPEYIDAARESVAALHRRLHFDVRETLERLGIRADLGFYRRVEGRSEGEAPRRV